ncbi:hypothetical protein BDZ91DRAFT_647624 [Kalaharituber pfeilii]|nr:hypothetical protein BDZ91DRAFT_647624 [Kalaharituber pfeilii]
MLPYPGAQPLPSGQYLVPGYAQVLPEQHDTRKVQPPATNLQGDTNSAPTPGQYQKGDRYQRHSSSRPRQRYQNTPRRLEPGHDNQNESSLQPPRELRLGLIDDGFPPLGAGKLKPWEDNFTRVSGQSNSRETGIRQPQSSDKLPFGYRPNYNPISPHQAPSAPRHRGPRNFPHRNFPHSGAQQQPYQPSEKELSIISEVIAEQVAIATPPDDELLYKKKLHERLQRLCKNVSPTAELKAFGSLVSGFATVGSDLDLVLVDSISPTSQPYFEVPLLLEQELKDNGLVAQLLAKTRVPILKIVQPPADEFPYEVAADIGFANPLAIHNTDMLYTYSKCDPRVVDMVRFVKRWAKQRKINNPYLGTLSSYGYVLMILHYLINVVQPPVLPNLQLYPIPPGTPQSEIITEEGHNIWYYKDRETLEKQAAEGSLTSNTMDLTTLLLGFFEFYAYKFGWVRDIISIRTEGGLITKMDKGWVTAAVRIGKMETEVIIQDMLTEARYLFAIEDPFETNHNVSRTCNFYGVRKIREEFKRANRILRMREGEMALRNKLFQEAPEEIRHHRGDGQEKLAHDAVDEQEPLSEPNEAEPDLLV